MKMHINADVPANLTPEEALQTLRVQEDDREEFLEIFHRCMKTARPKYCFCEAESAVEADGTRIGSCCFDNRILRVNLLGLNRVFPGIATCGREIYDLSRACDDILQRYWIDGIAEMLMQNAAAAMREQIRGITGEAIRAMSPGSLADFPLIEQEKLFHLLGNAPGQIGVELTPEFLMLPQKSTSSVYFASAQEYENCMLCLREGCANRRAPFREEAFLERFGLNEADLHQVPGR